MTRKAIFPSMMTPLSEFIRTECRVSKDKLGVTDIDHVLFFIEDYTPRSWKLMLIEEKRPGGDFTFGQSFSIRVLDKALSVWNGKIHLKGEDRVYEYWGLFLIRYKNSLEEIEINEKKITIDELRRHINFEHKIICGFRW